MWVYLLQSIPFPRQRYIGLAEDARKRLLVHNSGGSPHTAKFKPWRMVVLLWFDDEKKAVAFE